MKLVKLSLVSALLVATTTLMASDESSDLEMSANVAMTSDYIWRGMTQSGNAPAIQGGFDASFKGLYAGVWASNVDFGKEDKATTEFDFYLGYSNNISNLTYDIGFIQYAYPTTTDELNFGEAVLGLEYDFKVMSISATYYLGVDTNDVENVEDDWEPEDNTEFGISIPLPLAITIDGTYGQYNKTGDYYSAGLSRTFGKFDFSLAYTGMKYDDKTKGEDGKEDNVVFTLGSSF
jgi:uncharacterized protein (TIGR02001 family)